eukprot:TRINITY_DN957_c0_g1_i1.p1 TRINITY_DN957_c0_g1~~TRINITY_DN957_c0_g1_i1.p1  ORF type:complete len:311 (+),score=80.32 TRINITY_DN957_c0_g1_i1:182-1114(+)
MGTRGDGTVKKRTILDEVANYKRGIYAGLAGAISRTATAPLERLKVLNQIQHFRAEGDKYKGVWSALRTIYKEEGFLANFKGNGTNVIRIIPSEATRYYSYSLFETALKNNSVISSYINPYILKFIAGGFSGISSTLLTYPLDLSRSRLSAQTTFVRYKGMFHCLWITFKEEGVRGLYKGLVISMMGIAPYASLNLASYDGIQSFIRTNYPHVPWLMSIAGAGTALGAISGTIAVTLTYPSDVLRRRMMIDGVGSKTGRRYKGILDAISQITRTEGVRGFFRGLVPCYLKVVPSTAISWTTIEACKRLFD